MQLSKAKIDKTIEKKIFKSLYQTIADLRRPYQVRYFLKDILTKTERFALAKRLAIAVYLSKDIRYDQIKKDLKVSSASIAWVQRSLIENRVGFRLALEAIAADEWAGKLAKKITARLHNWFKTSSK